MNGRFGFASSGLGASFGLVLFPFEITLTPAAFLHFVALYTHISLFTMRFRCGCLARNMKIRFASFNTYLTWLALLAPLLGGCLTTRSEKRAEASLRFHLEANLDGTERSQAITIGRSDPFAMGVETRCFLTEFNIEQATVVDTPGGFALSIQFNKEGGWILEQYSTVNKGRRVAIAAEFGELRWIAAPVMRDRITNGLFVFTPDTTREEAEKIARGVNVVAEKVRKDTL
jgi:hypothetical protein